MKKNLHPFLATPPENDDQYINNTTNQEKFTLFVIFSADKEIHGAIERYFRASDPKYLEVESLVWERLYKFPLKVYDAYSKGALNQYVYTIAKNVCLAFLGRQKKLDEYRNHTLKTLVENEQQECHNEYKKLEMDDFLIESIFNNLHLFAKKQKDALIFTYEESQKANKAAALKSVCERMGITRSTLGDHFEAIRDKIILHITQSNLQFEYINDHPIDALLSRKHKKQKKTKPI